MAESLDLERETSTPVLPVIVPVPNPVPVPVPSVPLAPRLAPPGPLPVPPVPVPIPETIPPIVPFIDRISGDDFSRHSNPVVVWFVLILVAICFCCCLTYRFFLPRSSMYFVDADSFERGSVRLCPLYCSALPSIRLSASLVYYRPLRPPTSASTPCMCIPSACQSIVTTSTCTRPHPKPALVRSFKLRAPPRC